MVWGFIGSMEPEVALIKQKMDIEETVCIAGAEFCRGTLMGQRIAVVRCGIGKANAAMCSQLLITAMKAECVVNLGVAGALSPELNIFDVVISSQAVYHDADLGSAASPGTASFTDPYTADSSLVTLAATACEEIRDQSFQCHIGRIATGDVFVQDARLKQSIAERCRPLCVEMEGAAAAQTAAANRIPFVIIRSISDKADDDAGMNYAEFVEIAASHSARIVCKMLELASLNHPAA